MMKSKMKMKNLIVAAVVMTLIAGAFVSCAGMRHESRAPTGAKRLDMRFALFAENRDTISTSRLCERVRLSLSPPPGLSTAGCYSRRPLYGSFRLGDSDYVALFDESRGTGSGHDLCYVDRNNNKSLADEEALQAPSDQHSYYTEFPVAQLEPACSGKAYPYAVELQFRDSSYPYAYILTAGYWQRTVTGSETEYAVALFDYSTNGRFDDVYAVPENSSRSGSIYARGDVLLVDRNGDGKLDGDYNGSPEQHWLGKYLALDGKWYELEVAPTGQSLTLRKCKAPCGKVKAQAGSSFDLLCEDVGDLKIIAGDGNATVPAGSYHMVNCCFEATDSQGARWRASGQGAWSLPVLEVKKGKSAELPYGQPFTARVDATRNGQEMTLSLKLEGQGGETYTANTIRSLVGSSGMGKPKFEVRDKAGKVLASENFEYG